MRMPQAVRARTRDTPRRPVTTTTGQRPCAGRPHTRATPGDRSRRPVAGWGSETRNRRWRHAPASPGGASADTQAGSPQAPSSQPRGRRGNVRVGVLKPPRGDQCPAAAPFGGRCLPKPRPTHGVRPHKPALKGAGRDWQPAARSWVQERVRRRRGGAAGATLAPTDAQDGRARRARHRGARSRARQDKGGRTGPLGPPSSPAVPPRQEQVRA